MDKAPRIQEKVGVDSKIKEVLVQENGVKSKMKEVLIQGNGVEGTDQLCSECLASAKRLGQLEDETEKAVAIVQV